MNTTLQGAWVEVAYNVMSTPVGLCGRVYEINPHTNTAKIYVYDPEREGNRWYDVEAAIDDVAVIEEAPAA